MTAKKTDAAADPKAKTAAKPVAKPAAKPAAEAPAKAAALDVKVAKASAKPAAKADKPAAKPEKPAAKGKAKAEPKKVEKAEEDDLADIDAEFTEPEAEVEAVADEGTVEVEAKAKPLRMKVSRAKERALMREFGLDETTLTEEEVAKRRLELKTLIKMGKTRGFLTHQEINDHLPEKLVDNEILEAIVSMLNDMGIAVYEQAPDAATLLIAGGTTTTAT